ncbi:MAG: hypothetical protein RJA98_2295 [Pseudomonadota bacterium]
MDSPDCGRARLSPHWRPMHCAEPDPDAAAGVTGLPAPGPVPTPSRKRETLTRLLREARRAFSAHGLANTRVDDIARAAGITKQLVYHYFGSKEQLFASVLDESTQELLADLLTLELDHLPPTPALRLLLAHLFEQYRADPALSALAQESFRLHQHHAGHANRFTGLVPTLLRLTGSILARGVASGEFTPGVAPRMFLAAAGLLVTGGFNSRYVVSTLAGFDTSAPEGMDRWRDHAIDFALAAVRLQGGPTAGPPSAS